MGDEQLVDEMHTENRHRKDLSAYERGMFYGRLLQEGLFKNPRELSMRLGVSASDVSRTLFLARLPGEVTDILHSPLELAIHDAHKLRPALEADPQGVIDRARKIAESLGTVSTKEAIRLLTQDEVGGSNMVPRELVANARKVGEMKVPGSRRVRVSLCVPLGDRDVDGLQRAIEKFLERRLVSETPVCERSAPSAPRIESSAPA
jgi:ParB family chromosome partitioning protein